MERTVGAGWLRAIGYLVVLLMACAMAYAGYITLANLTSIGV